MVEQLLGMREATGVPPDTPGWVAEPVSEFWKGEGWGGEGGSGEGLLCGGCDCVDGFAAADSSCHPLRPPMG